MISITKIDDVIRFTFSNSQRYPYGDGTIDVPVNSLSLVTDSSDMATFRKAATNDIFISGLYSEFGKTKAELETYFKENMVSTGGGGGTSYEDEFKGMIDKSITEANIPSGITTIGTYAFYNCTALSSVTMSDSVTTIGSSAFTYCTSLTSCTIGSGVTSISESAFLGCTSLTSIDIPNSVTSIGVGAFNRCSGLTSIDIPNSVTGIGSSAFAYCSGLTSVTIGSGITSIGVSSFYNCTSLTSCTIGSGVTTIGDRAFRNCSSLESITINATTPPTLGGTAVFDNTNNCPIYVPADSVDTYKAADVWSTYSDRIQAITS